jgi:tetratricopeptide (TPR) repeat protein
MPHDRRPLWICLSLVLLTLAAYSPLLGGGYDFLKIDDDEYVTYNPHVRAGLTRPSLWWDLTTFHSYNWHPLTWMSLQLDYQLFGLQPWGYHATNLLLHTANTILLFVALRRLTGAVWRSAAVAAFFAVHPLHVESVAWVAERKDLLSALFWMLALWAYAGYAERSGLARYLLVVLAFLASLLSKPMAVTLPCVLLLLDYWPLGRLRFGGDPETRIEDRGSRIEKGNVRSSILDPRTSRFLILAEKLPLLALAGGVCVITLLAQRGAVKTLEQFSLPVRLLNALLAYVGYIGKLFWPHPLAAFYPHPGARLPIAQAAAAGVLLASISAWVLLQPRQRGYLVVGWFWYLGTLVPVIGLVQVGSHAVADRYTYLPLIGLFLMLVWGVPDFLTRPHKPEAAALLCACVVATRLHIPSWHNTLTVWLHALEVTPEHNAQAHAGVGQALQESGSIQEALGHFEEVVRLEPDRATSHLNLGLVLGMLGRMDEAESHLRRAVQLDPQDAVAHTDLATLLARRGQVEEALGLFDEALAFHPNDAATHYNLGGVLMKQGQVEEAARHFTDAAEIDPLLADARDSLGTALQRQGKLPEAMACYRQAVALKPEHAPYRCNLALALQEAGRTEEADAEFRRALRIDPRWPFLANQTAWKLATAPEAQSRDGFTALRLARQSCYVAGDAHPAPLDTLAAAYAEAGLFDQAVEVARRAAELADSRGQNDLASQIRERSRLYEKRQPFHGASPGS